MKAIYIYILSVFLALPFAGDAEKDYYSSSKPAGNFGPGEKITYTVKYNLYFNISVGEVTFEVAKNPKKIAGSDYYHLTGTGRTYGFYDPFFKVRDKYESYVDPKTILPVVFIRNVEEGGFKFSEYVIFDQKAKIARSKKRTQKIPSSTFDVLSAIYYARTLDFDNAQKGQKFMLNAFIDDSTYYCGVKYLGKEVIKTQMGKFRCIKLQPVLIVDRMFKSEDEMTLWVTDDANRIPVRIESGISVGKVMADISAYSGLKHDLSAKL